MAYALRFLQTVGHPSALAFNFRRCGQLRGGLAPPGVRPCRARNEEGRLSRDRRPSVDPTFR